MNNNNQQLSADKPKGRVSISTEEVDATDTIVNQIYTDDGTKTDIRKDASLDQGLTPAQEVAAAVKLAPVAAPTMGKATKGSRVLSVGSHTSSQNGEHRFAREVSETFTWKLREMKWCVIALVSNILMLAAIQSMSMGTIININYDIANTWEGIVLEILLLITNIFTIMAMDTGSAAFFGFRMATRGESMAAIGFSQTSATYKLNFANDLSLNSTVRKILNRLAFLWVIMEILKLITPLGASSLKADVVRKDEGTVDCVVFGQVGEPDDRQWPNVEAELGVAELIFGSSIGRLRSEEDVPFTTALISPQLVGVVNDGDTIVGDGFHINITTNCRCSLDDSPAKLESAGVPDSAKDAFSAAARGLASRNVFMTSTMENFSENKTFRVTSMFLNSFLCGGLNKTGVPVCQTEFADHRTAKIMMEYMTDGTTASIAPKKAVTRELGEPVDINTWAYAAMENILGAGVQTIPLPSQVPAMMASILWWSTADLMALDPALLETGLETMYTILFRAGVQRTYSTAGSKCVRNVVDGTRAYMKMADYGANSGVTAVVIQLVFNVLAIVAFVPWLLSNVPAGPAIRAMNESIYFTTLLSDSNLADNLKGLCNAPTHQIWQSLDVIVRIGESIMTQDEPVGHITMDKPKVVRPMINARRYA